MKKIIALTLALAFVLSAAGCGNSELNEAVKVLETDPTDEISENAEDFEPDTLYDYHDISFYIDSDWEIDQIGTENIHFTCTSSCGILTLKFNSYNEETCTKMFENRLETYCGMTDAIHTVVDLSDVSISKVEWKSNNGREKTYFFMYNDCIYQLDFYVSEESENTCSMFENSETVINSIAFRNQKTSEQETEQPETSGNKTSSDVDEISESAKAVAEKATPEDAQNALNSLRALSGHFYESEQNMYSVMYNGQILYYYFEGTDTPYEQAGFYAFTAVKYVYRGIDTVDSPDTADSLTKFAAALMQCDDINNEVQEVQEVYTELPVQYTEPPVQHSSTVYITPTGKKYHYDSNCNGGNYNPTDLDTAKSMGLEPCKKCT